MKFACEVFGKWILTGEHAVLRGGGALVFPLKGRSLKLNYTESFEKTGLALNVSGLYGEEYKLLFWGVFEKAMQIKNLHRDSFNGQFNLEANLPIGAGLGASATLCVAIVKWLLAEDIIEQSEALEFARQLENLFHGESSGLDVAVALFAEPLLFYRNQKPEVFKASDLGVYWMISYCGQRGITADCIHKVKSLFVENEKKAQLIDQQMRDSVTLSLKAFESNSLPLMIQSIELAKGCFNQWELSEGKLQSHMVDLYELGALACKPTGSGGGGYVLSLWDKRQFESIHSKIEFYPCF